MTFIVTYFYTKSRIYIFMLDVVVLSVIMLSVMLSQGKLWLSVQAHLAVLH
jgi:hypothetical protein